MLEIKGGESMQRVNGTGLQGSLWRAALLLLALVGPAGAQDLVVSEVYRLDLPALLFNPVQCHSREANGWARDAVEAVNHTQWEQAERLYSDALQADARDRVDIQIEWLRDRPANCRGDLLYGRAVAGRHTGNPGQAQADIEHARRFFESDYGPDSWHVALAEGERAAQLAQAGQLPEARKLFRHALELVQQGLPPDDHKTTALMLSLAQVLQAQGDRSHAQEYFREVRRLSGPYAKERPRQVFRATFALVLSLSEDCEYEEAQSVALEGVALMERYLPATDVWVAAAYRITGDIFAFQGQYARAEPFYRRALTVYQAANTENAWTAGALTGLALLMYKQDRQEEAQGFSDDASQLWDRLNPQDYPNAAPMANLATLLHIMGREVQAEVLWRRLLALNERGQDTPHDPDTWAGLAIHLAMTLADQQKTTEALSLAGQAIDLRRQRFGETDVRLTEPLCARGKIFHMAGQLQSAEHDLRRGLELQSQVANAETSQASQCALWLGEVLAAEGERAEALKWNTFALKVREKLSGANEDLAELLEVIGEAERARGALAQAEEHLRRAWEIRCEKLGPREATVTSAYNLAATFFDERRPDLALLPLMESLAQMQHFDASPSVAVSLNMLLSQVWKGDHWFASAERVRRQALKLCAGPLEPEAKKWCPDLGHHRET